MKIGDEVYVHGFVDEIRKDTVIIRNDGGYFGTDRGEIVSGELRTKQDVEDVIDRVLEIIDKAQTYKMAVGSTDLFIDREAFRDEVLALKGEQG